jgi:predicted acylesterase/phospholipase RssA
MFRIDSFLQIGAVTLCALLAGGCRSPHVERLSRAEAPEQCVLPAPERDLLLGVALSGGGSRAALYSAAALEALARLRVGPEGRSLLEQVSYLSSVSGGSLAATYYAMRKPPRESPILTANGELTTEYRRFFDGFKDAMRQDLEWPTLVRQVTRLRLFNPTKAATSVAEVLDERFLDGATLGDLHQRERRGHSPRLIINTTLYNNGRRFVITNLPQPVFQYDFVTQLQRTLEARGRAAGRIIDALPSLLRAQETLLPATFEDIGAHRCKVPLSKAVVASASFPTFIGPVTAQVDGAAVYWHAGDGGLFDNQGTESLVQVFLRQLQEGKARRALVIALDSSFPFFVGNERLARTDRGFALFDDDPARIPGIMEQRANAYQAMIWHVLQSEGIVVPDAGTLQVVVLRHIEAEWQADLADLPASCRAEDPPLVSPQAVVQRLAQILTRFRIDSVCDQQLIEAAAHKTMRQQQQRILDFIARPPGAAK